MYFLRIVHLFPFPCQMEISWINNEVGLIMTMLLYMDDDVSRWVVYIPICLLVCRWWVGWQRRRSRGRSLTLSLFFRKSSGVWWFPMLWWSQFLPTGYIDIQLESISFNVVARKLHVALKRVVKWRDVEWCCYNSTAGVVGKRSKSQLKLDVRFANNGKFSSCLPLKGSVWVTL